MKLSLITLHLLGLASLFLTGCDEEVSSHYDTRKEADNDQLFRRGWLPVIIPASSYDITTTNDLDLNTSEGAFSFNPADSKEFLSCLRKMETLEIPSDMKQVVNEQGYTAYEYQSQWVFYINEVTGHCQYRFVLQH